MAEGRLDTDIHVDKSDDKTVVELAKAFVVMQDAVKHRERSLNDARARIEAIVNSATSAIISVDEHGTIIRANLATQTLFDYPPKELEGRKLSELAHDSYVDSLFSGEGETIGKPREIIAQRADGTTFPAEISVSKAHTSRRSRAFVVMLTDLSERKRYENLENQLKLERIKGEFVSTVSHELRTPLTAIAGSLALLRSDRLGSIPPNAKPLLNIAHSNSERLMRLINDILDMEKIKSGTLSFVFEELDVAMILYEAARSNTAYADQLDVKIKVARIPQGILIMGDPDRIAQALSNLISNAAKFSRKGRHRHPFGPEQGWLGAHLCCRQGRRHSGSLPRPSLLAICASRLHRRAAERRQRARPQHHQGHRRGPQRQSRIHHRHRQGHDILHRPANRDHGPGCRCRR